MTLENTVFKSLFYVRYCEEMISMSWVKYNSLKQLDMFSAHSKWKTDGVVNMKYFSGYYE